MSPPNRSVSQPDEARHFGDDWRGKTDPKARRKLQNRLNQRAWRNRKATTSDRPPVPKRFEAVSKQAEAEPIDESVSRAFREALKVLQPPQNQQLLHAQVSVRGLVDVPAFSTTKTSDREPGSLDDLLRMNLETALQSGPKHFRIISKALRFGEKKSAKRLIPPVIPYIDANAPMANYPDFTFPISPDHYLITLIQYNVLRASITNMAIVSVLPCVMPPECWGAFSVTLLPDRPNHVPQTMEPTYVQRTTPHDMWIDSLPDAQLRDNLILTKGQWDEDDFCCDCMGGLFEGFDDIRTRGLLVWGDPWLPQNWEVSEGFAGKWGFLLKGCEQLKISTNVWRGSRGEDAIVWAAEER